MSAGGAGARSAMSHDAGLDTYTRREFELYERIICAGDSAAIDLSDEAFAIGSTGTDKLTFADWQRESRRGGRESR